MDIVESLTADFDHLRDLTIDLAIATTSQERENLFRRLVRYQDVTSKAQASALNIEVSGALEFAKRKMLERCDVMDEIATNVHRSNRSDVREAKMDLYSDLVIQRISESEREILPYLFENVSEDERRKMAAEYEKYRDIALNHDFDHPHAV